jgi:hypothetical protein
MGNANIDTGKLNNLESYDYHVIMERLLPIIFYGYVQEDVWRVLAELSFFIDSYVLRKLQFK